MKKIITSLKYRLNWYKIMLLSVALVLTGIYSITVKGQTGIPLTVNATVSEADKQAGAVRATTTNTGRSTYKQSNGDPLYRNSGYTDVFSLTSTTPNLQNEETTLNAAGLIISMSIYHNGGTGKVIMGIYSDGIYHTADQLLGETAPTTINPFAGWQTIQLKNPVLITSELYSTVFMAWVFEDNPGIRYETGPGSSESPITWRESLPETFGVGNSAALNYSVYCTYKPADTAKTLSVSRENISLKVNSGSEDTVYITSNTSWSVSEDASWLEVSPVSGSNSTTITLTSNSFNYGFSPRTATVTISGTGVADKTLTVTQEYLGLASEGNFDVYDSTSTSAYLTAQPVTLHEPGEIEDIALYHNGGTGNVIMGVYSDQDGSPSSLLGFSAPTPIYSSEGWQFILLKNKVKVNSGQTVWLSWIFENNPGVRYTTGAPSAAKSTSEWSDGMPNTFGLATTEDYKYTIFCDYLQVAKTLDFSTTNISLGYNSGSSKTVNVTSNTSWRIWRDPGAGWIDLSPWDGSNNGTFTVTANSANTGPIPRTANVTIEGTGIGTKTILVTQDAAPLVTATGKIAYQVWNNIGNGLTVSSLTSNINYPSNPTSSNLITSMEGTTDLGDSYGARIVGYIYAPATGSYTFWIASDDYGELWLSTNDNPANKHKIAYVNGYTRIREWNKYAAQKSATVNLVQGQKYYVEALMKEASGNDNLAVGWLKPGQSGTEPSEVIPGSVLSPYGTIPVGSVTLPLVLNLKTGASAVLPATVLPANATVKILNWSTSDPTVALVNSYGIVTGISAGNATIMASSTDESNKSGTCVVTVAGVPTICSATGNITYQVWNNIGSSYSISSLTGDINYPYNPSSSALITSMEAPPTLATLFGSRIAGYICAPATGSYTFWIASDNEGELWLSTDDQPANKLRIAYHNGNTFPREWNKYPTQKSVVINLVQGQKYYIEALMKQVWGGSCQVVGWLKPGQSGTIPSEVIPGSVLSPIGPAQAVLVSSVALPPTSAVNIGYTVLIPATVLPANAPDKTLNWTTGNPAIATVNSSGLVTGMAEGSTTITATSTDGSNISGNCLVMVSAVPTVCSATGNISYQVWNNIGSSYSISSLTGDINYPYNPSSSALITSMEAPPTLATLFGSRIAGYICAPATGSYTFWIASDNEGELWLSTDDQSANKVRIAYHNGYTASREWNKYPTQKSVVIDLVQGHSYYIEALMKQVWGGSCQVVGWLKPGQSGTVPSEVIPGSVLSPLTGVVLSHSASEIKTAEIISGNPEISKSDVILLVYPNPLVENVLNIKLENLKSEATLRIFTITGIKCYEEIIQNSETIKVDRSVFKNGMYIIQIENDDFVKTTKLIVN